MNKSTIAIATAITTALIATASIASATDYAVHVHGRLETHWTTSKYGPWQPVECDYNSTTYTLAQGNAQLRSCFQQYCTGSNRCILVAYSNGAHQVAYTQAYYPSVIANAVYVEAGGSAAGGSELVDVAEPIQKFIDWFGDDEPWFQIFYGSGVDATLGVSSARNAYNHYLNAGMWTYHVAGDTDAGNWIWYATAWALPGDDDGVVSFASAYQCSSSGSQDWDCSKYTNHTADTWCDSEGKKDGADHFDMNFYASYCY
jgi:pimeloyl-ACP methyl ester carboxylesterase